MDAPRKPDPKAPSGSPDVDSRDQLRLFIENVREYAIFTLDPHNRITTWNTGAERLLGWSESEAIGRSGEMVFTPEDRASGAVAAELGTADEKGSAADERVHLRKDGSRFWATGTLMILRDADGTRRGYAKIMRDNTERRQAQESLERALRESESNRLAAERANHTKSEFISTVSHELRTPLNNILLWSRMLASGKVPHDDWAKGMHVIERAAQAQRQLIDDLLDISRMEAGKLRLAMRPTLLVEVIQGAVESVRPMLESRDLRIEQALGEDVGIVLADPERLQQVVWNLIANSIKFTPDRGRIRVDAHRDGADVEIVVSDTGTGIPADFLPFVFERFRQAEEVTTRTHSGLGLGLAIARELIDLHGGSITAASAGKGLGATFTVRLPLPRLHEDEQDAVPTVPSEPRVLQGIRVLLVEDNAETREATRRVLEIEGASVRVARTAVEARDAYAVEAPDVLLCDVGLPSEDGLSLMRRLRQVECDSSCRRVPAVAVSAFARPEDERAALDAGFDAQVSKPVDTRRLVELITELLRTGAREPT